MNINPTLFTYAFAQFRNRSMMVYEFTLKNGEVHRFEVDVHRDTAQHREDRADWTRLGYHQCANCPLSKDEHKYCPVAVDIEQVAERFKNILSFERADVRVLSDARDYLRNCDVQTGLKSLLGLIMASSQCPTLSQFKPMAIYHLPFATVEETVYRVSGAYLLKQYFLNKEGNEPDMKLLGLENFYRELQQVNKDFMRRIRAASQSDANLNAINILLSLSAVVALTLDERLEDIKPLFFEGLNEAEVKK